MSFRLWEIAKDPEKRAVISWLGAGIIVIASGIWAVFTFVVDHDGHDKKGGTNITVQQGIGSVGEINAPVTFGPSKEQTEQIQKPLAEQLGKKDAQIAALNNQNAALTKLLLEKNPAAGPGAQQAVGAAVQSIAQGAAEGDTRLQQALDFLKENKIADATQILTAIAEDKRANAEQDPKDAAIAYRNLGAIAGLRGHALLIGVSGYTSGWDQLSSVKNDLHDLEEGLAPYFETVETVQSPTAAKIRAKMGEFLMRQWNRPDERLFIYYSGHGFTVFNQLSRRNDGYITGSDTPLYKDDGRAVANAVAFNEIDSWSRQTKARHVLMVFDSCFSGSLFQTIMREPNQNELDSLGSLFQTTAMMTEPSQNGRDVVRRLMGKPMRYYITACRQNEEVSADGTFAKLLLRGLSGDADRYHEGIISAEELGNYLYHEVPKYSQRPQTPQFNSIANARLSEGQFFFLTGPAAPR